MAMAPMHIRSMHALHLELGILGEYDIDYAVHEEFHLFDGKRDCATPQKHTTTSADTPQNGLVELMMSSRLSRADSTEWSYLSYRLVILSSFLSYRLIVSSSFMSYHSVLDDFGLEGASCIPTGTAASLAFVL
eukprot:5778729-Amphidinium_carterae.1